MPDFDLFIANRTVAAMEGKAVSFSDDDLRGIAERYDPALHEAPLIIGHPQHDAPAFGWVKGLSFADGRLQADEHQVQAEFADMRKQGLFKKLSARFFTPDHPNNPTPGQFYLRDVGFLGAMAPAVKGLRTFSFGDDAGQLASCELSFADFPAHGGTVLARILGRFREWVISQSGLEAADRIASSWEIESLREMSQRAAEAPSSPTAGLRSFADQAPNQEQSPMTDAEKAQLADAERKNAELQAENRRLQQLQVQADTDKRVAANMSFADGLIKDGRWPSGHRELLVTTLNHLSAPVEGQCISFGDGDAAKPLHEALRAGLQELPALVSFGDVATKSAAAGTTATKTDRQIADEAVAWKKSQAEKGRHVSFTDAVSHVTAEATTSVSHAKE